MTSKPHIVSRKLMHDGWNTLNLATVESFGPDGRVTRNDREIVDHGNASVVLVVDRERDVALLVRQLRAPLLETEADPFLLEVCAGIIDPGETPEQTARREATEEVGVTVRDLRHIGDVFPSAGTLTEQMHLYIAEIASADRTAPGGGMEGEGENIEVVEMPLPELFRMAREGRIIDAKTLILTQVLMIEELESRVGSTAAVRADQTS
jgi:GDP-mannose pyrophosphatase NudK